MEKVCIAGAMRGSVQGVESIIKFLLCAQSSCMNCHLRGGASRENGLVGQELIRAN